MMRTNVPPTTRGRDQMRLMRIFLKLRYLTLLTIRKARA